jgi:malate dehydrogenase (oxaloacetate-decarboxylating)(NADP+)
MMVEMGDAEAYVAGLESNYPEVLRPALEVVGVQQGMDRVSGVYITIVGDKVFFLTDATVNIEPTSQELAEIAIMAADFARSLDVKPEIAMLSFSNFGSTHHPSAARVQRAVELVRDSRPDLKIDGEMQADTAVAPDILAARYPFSHVKRPNVLVFPDLQSANIAYKLLRHLGGAETIGPVLLGMGKPIQVLQTGDEVRDIVNLVSMTVLQAMDRQ